MLHYDREGLYGDKGLLAAEDLSSPERLEKAMGQLQARFDAGELGFFGMPDFDPALIEAWAEEKLQEGWTDQVVIGIGGSSLGARAVLKTALPKESRGLRTHFAENLDPETVDRLVSTLDLKRTLIVVITKSGTTIETMSQFWILWQELQAAVGEEAANQQIVAITDPENGELRKLASQYGWKSFEVPPNVGGRFSVLTSVGLVPLALAGYPIRRLLKGAREVRDGQGNGRLWAQIADEYLALERKGVNELVMMTYGDRLDELVDWFSQLWAESLGKAKDRAGNTVHTGITPIKAVGVIDQHSQVQLYMEGPANKHISFLEVRSFERDRVIPESPPMPPALRHLQGRKLSEVFLAELQGTRRALQQAGRPTSTWVFETISPETVGAFLFGWQMITAMAGELLGIDAFDQPGVELGKKIAHGLLGREGFEKYAAQARGGGDSVKDRRNSLL